MRTLLTALTGLIFTAVGVSAVQADDFHGSRGDDRFHDKLEQRAYHRELEHQAAHRRPLTDRQHDRLHDRLEEQARRDYLRDRAYHAKQYRQAYRPAPRPVYTYAPAPVVRAPSRYIGYQDSALSFFFGY